MQGYFYTAVGYVFIGVFLAVSSVLFYLSILKQRSGDLPGFISQMSYLWMLLSPILTMRLLAEEKQKKTDQLLFTSPVSLPGIVLGKYLAAVTVLLLTAGLTLLFVLVVALYGRVYPAELAVNYLGFILQGCAFVALDLFLSGCAGTPVTAAVMAFGAELPALDSRSAGNRGARGLDFGGAALPVRLPPERAVRDGPAERGRRAV
jgi:ABC-type transport system involved in multi-copper enzyme maturation, permease component